MFHTGRALIQIETVALKRQLFEMKRYNVASFSYDICESNKWVEPWIVLFPTG